MPVFETVQQVLTIVRNEPRLWNIIGLSLLGIYLLSSYIVSVRRYNRTYNHYRNQHR